MNKEKFIQNIKSNLNHLIDSESAVLIRDCSIVKEKFEEILKNEIVKIEKYISNFNDFYNLMCNIEKIRLSNFDDDSILTLDDISFQLKNNYFYVLLHNTSNIKSISLNSHNNMTIHSGYGYNHSDIKSCIHVLSVNHNTVKHNAMWFQEEKFTDYFKQELFNHLLSLDLNINKKINDKLVLIKNIALSFVNPLYNSIDVDFKLNLTKIPDNYNNLLEININTYKKENLLEIRDLILVNCDIDIFDKVGTFLKETNILKNKI